MQLLWGILFEVAAFMGRTFGISHSRIYDYLGRAAFQSPEFAWHKDRWGNELYLSPYYAIDRDILVTGTYHAPLNMLIERLIQPGMVCMDVGANIGHIALHMARRVGTTGRVYAFEPVSGICALLRNNVARNKLGDIVAVEEIALSQENGTAAIAYADRGKENQGMGSLVDFSNEVATLKQEVRICSLDSFMNERKVSRLDFIKIDIQGAELLFLKGAKQTLSHYSPDICFEVSPHEQKCFNKTPMDLLGAFSNYQYKFYEIEKDGIIGTEIFMTQITPDFSRNNIYCSKR